jgi:23S rRNA G2445 N2-methylase RlmL
VPVCDTLRLVGVPGSNKVMAGELSRLCRRALGLAMPTPAKAGPGALVYPFDPGIARIAALYHRTASRVLWDRFESDAERLEPLYDELAEGLRGDVGGWLWDGATVSVRARNVSRFAAGERQVVGTVKNAVVAAAAHAGLRVAVDPDRPDVSIAVRMHDEALTVSVDLVGRAMHRRGWRPEAADAPLRENLAATLVMLSRWDARSEVLIDPVAGSGTIAIEASLMASAAPLWPSGEVPALFRLPRFRDVASGAPPLFADTQPRVVANEIDTRTIAVARDNVARALAPVITAHGDFRDLHPHRLARLVAGWDLSRPGVILGNPPWGERMEGDVVALYRELGRWCEQFRGWRAGFYVANPDWEGAFGRRARVVKPLASGGLRANFYLYEL